jgi:PAS domain S-box-containing protein
VKQRFPLGVLAESERQVLCEDGERIFCRGSRRVGQGKPSSVLLVLLGSERPSPAAADRLAHEYGLRAELDPTWAALPLALYEQDGRPVLVLQDPGGESLEGLVGGPMETSRFLRLGIGIASALAKAHGQGLVHKDIKPVNLLVNCTDGGSRLTGFGIASRLPRERHEPEPPEVIAGTLAYMAPEQTGRMNRSIDSRSDLYALGVTLYRMLTGDLPFSASDAMEWVHCHIARMPVPPAEKVDGIPAAASHIVMKLLAKTGEERYQTAAGLRRDLERALVQWETQERVDEFPLGAQDQPDRLLIPETLYGRERDVTTLLAAFDRVVETGSPELVLVSGYSGIGKSSVVNELHRALVPPRGLFASGKFDQYKSDIPYSTLAQACQGLVRFVLGKSDAELARWRETLRAAVDPNGRLVTDLVPELTLVIGEQPPVPMLDSLQAKGRFHLVLRRFIGAIATAEHPLALFVDDLQWLDLATLDLMEDLLTQTDGQRLLLIGAYRDNEVDAQHPLTRRIASIRQRATVSEIKLGPLGREHVGQLTADALRTTRDEVAPLAQLVHAKTAGNPFFVLQFLHVLADEGLLAFDSEVHPRWDVERIQAKRYTDNVADLMVARLERLPVRTHAALRELACLGNVAAVATLAVAMGLPQEQIHILLWEAVKLELVNRTPDAYKFVHDRVQEAAYSGIPESLRSRAHLRIGRILASNGEGSDTSIFDIVNHLNKGAELITSVRERVELAQFNLVAGKRAQASTAYSSALTYLASGAAMLPKKAKHTHRDLFFQLELHRAECELLSGAAVDAEQRLERLSGLAAGPVEQASVTCLRMDAFTKLDQLHDAVRIGLAYLRILGIEWSPHPNAQETVRAFERLRSRLEEGGASDPVELPLMTDPVALATLEVLAKLTAPAHYTDLNLTSLTVCEAVRLSLDQGNGDPSCVAYLFLSMVAGRFGDLQAARRYGQIGQDLVDRRGLRRFQARAYVDYASLAWMGNFAANRDLARRAFEIANSSGDLLYATHAWWVTISNRLGAGDPLADVQREAETGIAFARKVGFGFVVGILAVQLGLMRTLRGQTRVFGSLDDSYCNDQGVEGPFSGNPNSARVECWYWIRKLQAQYLAGDHAGALGAAARAQPLLWTCVANLETAEHCFFSALARAGACGPNGTDMHGATTATLVQEHRQLAAWARHCAENYESRAELVGAELARVRGEDRNAMDGYERAIRSARANAATHIEALANELAGRFYAERGFDKIAQLYLHDARYCYLRWGADGKVRQLEENYPFLAKEDTRVDAAQTVRTAVGHLDLSTVLKVSQALSGERDLGKLISEVMRLALEHAGAERGMLILPREEVYRIEAQASVGIDAVNVDLRPSEVDGAELPQSAFQYVLRTRETVLIQDALADKLYAHDEYLRGSRARSVLCMPLLKQSRLVGVIYLENSLVAGAFTPARMALLELLASEAAISLENARLYRDLQEREARVRRLFNSNLIGIFTWHLDGRILGANDAFGKITGYGADELVSAGIGWRALLPPDWQRGDERLAALLATGVAPPFEAEYVKKNGNRVPVLVGAAMFEGSSDEGLAFVLDLSDRKQAEQAARDMERRFHEVQMQLSDAIRVASIGQLSASIAHEVNQPLSGIITNASTCLRMLDAVPPNIDGARETARRSIRDGHRAAEVITRLRAMFSNRDFAPEPMDLNEATREVIALSMSDLRRNRVVIAEEFAHDLPQVIGDRIQLQQVILNLLRNGSDAMCDVQGAPRDMLVKTEREGDDRVRLSVRDAGVGIDGQHADHLFTPFYTTKSGGMGIGLSLSRTIVERHHGHLGAEPNDGAGATFWFSIPFTSRRPPAPGDESLVPSTR